MTIAVDLGRKATKTNKQIIFKIHVVGMCKHLGIDSSTDPDDTYSIGIRIYS